MNRSARFRVGRYVPLLLTMLISVGCADRGDERPQPAASGDRQTEVADRGKSVMPFDLDRTTHEFSKTDDGGVQTVVADDPGDATQIALIQQHLRHEADRFRRGDFTDPAHIHGTAMPGLAALEESAGRIAIDYETTASGARITYTTADAALVTALHAWFDAQVTDHGNHATHG